MNTLGWGPHGWDLMFLIAIDAFQRKDPETNQIMFLSNKDAYINFYTFISAKIFPCVHCRNAWMKFNNPENRECINGCWGSILSFFLSRFAYSSENENENILVLWLFIMKNKVTKKLIAQEDDKMKDEIIKYLNSHPDDINKINNKNFIMYLETTINGEQNIKRVNREKVTYQYIMQKYQYIYKKKADEPTYFPYLFAVAFNAGWSDEGQTNIRRVRIPAICDDYITFFNYLSKLLPCEKLRNELTRNPAKNAFLPHIVNIQLSISPNTEDDNRLAFWLFGVFINANVIKNKNIFPNNFKEIIERYTRWRVVCTKTDSKLQTCRSKTPNRKAPLLTAEEYSRE